MTREQATAIAVDAARASHSATGQPSYFVEPFEPHPWVVDAIQIAAGDGQIVVAIDALTKTLAGGLGGIESELDRIANKLVSQ